MSILTPEIRNFIFSVLTEGTQATKQNSKNQKLRSSGELLSVTFIASKLKDTVETMADVKIKQRYSFVGYAGDSLLNEEEKQKLQSQLPFSIVEEMKISKHIFYMLDCKKKKIFEEKERNTGELIKNVI